jgi:NAD(P)-dependent dehydrogenase (short-subunit alcohol dehydrogenase family)
LEFPFGQRQAFVLLYFIAQIKLIGTSPFEFTTNEALRMPTPPTSLPSYSLQDRVVIVTGGGSGIGRAAALLCAERRARVAVFDVDGDSASQVAGLAQSRGAAAIGIGCDVRIEAEVERACSQAKAKLGSPYGLVASAGIDIGGFVHEMPTEAWQQVLATNLTGVYLACKYVVRDMIAAGTGGSIVLVSSPAASVSFAAGMAGAYSASKGGVSALVRCLAIDYAPNRIRVNAVVPGPTETALMWANVGDEEKPAMREKICAEVPIGRLADPNEIARPITWLLSDEASYVTGSHLICDGGVLAKGCISV